MAQKQKRPSPRDVPPSASSDEEEEQPIPSSQPRSEKEEEEEDGDVDSSSEEEEDDDEEEEKTQPDSKIPKPAASSESSTESDSGSESESESRGASDYQIQPKPLASKPMDETPLKANSKPSKRPAEKSNGNGDANRAKKKKVTDAAAASSEDNDDDGGVEAAEVKKSSNAAASDSKNLPFQRLFSEEDEIAILKGMIEFKKDTGNDPFKFADVFHGFMKKSLHIDASSNQLKQKIQRLKKKFEVNAKGKSFSKPHDKEAFELSKKIWGNAEVAEKAKSNGKAPKSVMKEGSRGNVAPSKLKSEPKQEVKLLMDSKEEAAKMVTDEKTDIPLSVVQGFGLYGLNENLMKRGLDSMGASVRAQLEKQWKELEASELEVSVKRVELIAKHSRLIWEAYKASNH